MGLRPASLSNHMQYTFLPQQEKVKALRDYRTRVAIVALFFIAVAFLIGSGALFPAYVSALLEKGAHVHQVTKLRNTEDAHRLAFVQQELAQSGALLQSATDIMTSFRYAENIARISKVRGSVLIDSFALDVNATKDMVVTISGIAPIRGDLLTFKNKLMQTIDGAQVDLPYATLARDTKVPYSMKITIHEAQP